MTDKKMNNDLDPVELQEWLDAVTTVVHFEGTDRAKEILTACLLHAQTLGVKTLGAGFSSYVNSISVSNQPVYPGNLLLEEKILSFIRWNAIAMVLRAKRDAGGVGGHLSSFASMAVLYEVGMNHFFRGRDKNHKGDFVYFQGHSAEGNYARAFLEGRLDHKHLENFRQESLGHGLSSYPHPWLMPDFWQFATVSLGLGPLQGIFQGQLIKYLENRGLIEKTGQKVWIFAGDGEMDEPESVGGLTLAAREHLDNVIYVVNCNLQRLDGLVRSNYKIIAELEALFQGAGWHVIKVLWSSAWDALFAKDTKGVLAKALGVCVDGHMQAFVSQGGAYFREHFFNRDPELAALIEGMSDADLEGLTRGGHDMVKVYAAYQAAMQHQHQPVCILAHCVKGFGLGTAGESQNIAHNALEMNEEQLKAFRTRFALPLTDTQLLNLEFVKPKDNSEEIRYLQDKRKVLGGYVPARFTECESLAVPALSAFEAITKGTEGREMSSTMTFARILNVILKDKILGPRVVPIFSDEVRTFGMEALFRQIGIYSPHGQLYEPEDKKQLMYYREAKDGQMLEEGINEAGCMAAWLAAGTAYSTQACPLIPVFTFYSMFGFQRIGDLIWAAGDMRARGFLIGATAGRTALEGEGLQHQDGHNLLVASHLPSCMAYDATFGYEMAVIMQEGLRRMMTEQEDIFYYITAMNEKYVHPAMPKGCEAGILKGLYLFKESDQQAAKKVQLIGSGAIFNEVLFAADILQKEFDVYADIWASTSFNELRRDGVSATREHRLNPSKKRRITYVEECLSGRKGPVIAATDYVKEYADQIREFVKASYTVLGTDGYGRSDTRKKLRTFFEVDRYYIVTSVLYALSQEGLCDVGVVEQALKKFNIHSNKPNPITV